MTNEEIVSVESGVAAASEAVVLEAETGPAENKESQATSKKVFSRANVAQLGILYILNFGQLSGKYWFVLYVQLSCHGDSVSCCFKSNR